MLDGRAPATNGAREAFSTAQILEAVTGNARVGGHRVLGRRIDVTIGDDRPGRVPDNWVRFTVDL